MRGLLVNNEDLLRTNAQLNNEMKRLREQMIEIDRELQARDEKIREMEVRVGGWTAQFQTRLLKSWLKPRPVCVCVCV